MIEPTAAPDRANLDAEEVAQFARQAKAWWDPNGPFRPLHQIGPVRLQYIRDAVVRHFAVTNAGRKPLGGLTCLDVGCGGGLISEPLARLGASVTAIDPAAENIATARAHADAVGVSVDYRAATAEDLAANDEQFDLVTCLEVIEHVPAPADFVATLARLVRPGGLIVMSTINRTPQSYALAVIGAEYVLRWLPVGTHDWAKFVRPSELERYMSAAGLAHFDDAGVVYNPIRDRWSLSKDTGVNYMASAAKA